MKRTGFRRRQLRERPIAWRETEYAALRDNAVAPWNDRVSEEPFELEDDHVEVDNIVHSMTREST